MQLMVGEVGTMWILTGPLSASPSVVLNGCMVDFYVVLGVLILEDREDWNPYLGA